MKTNEDRHAHADVNGSLFKIGSRLFKDAPKCGASSYRAKNSRACSPFHWTRTGWSFAAIVRSVPEIWPMCVEDGNSINLDIARGGHLNGSISLDRGTDWKMTNSKPVLSNCSICYASKKISFTP